MAGAEGSTDGLQGTRTQPGGPGNRTNGADGLVRNPRDQSVRNSEFHVSKDGRQGTRTRPGVQGRPDYGDPGAQRLHGFLESGSDAQV